MSGNFRRIADLIDADDKRVSIAPLSQIVRLQTVRAGLHVTIGVPREFMGPLSRGELSGGLLLVEPAALREEPAPAPAPAVPPEYEQAVEALRDAITSVRTSLTVQSPARCYAPHIYVETVDRWSAALAAVDAARGQR